MKYFKFTGGYFALIMAETIGQAVDIYIGDVGDFNEEEINYEEVDIMEVKRLASSAYMTPNETKEFLEISKNGTKAGLLLIDSMLL